jgi:hypothetical protein
VSWTLSAPKRVTSEAVYNSKVNFGSPRRRLAISLLLSAFALGAQPSLLNDSFASNRLDLGRWDLFSQGGATAATGAGLRISLNGANAFSSIRAFTFYQFTGDFDASVDFNLGAGWASPFPSSDSSPQLNGGGLEVYLDDPHWMMVFRSRFQDVEGFNFYSNIDMSAMPRSQFIPSKATTGSLRIVASAGTYHFSIDAGSGWTEIASAPAWNRPVRLALMAANVNAHVAFTTALTNFRVNSGETNYQPYQLPTTFSRRLGFLAGGQFINEAIRRWNSGFPDYAPMNQLAGQGMNFARGCMTAVSDPDLATTPVDQWHTLGWKESYWSSREMVAQLFKDAAAAGMRSMPVII